jgi:hypothetical protein
MELRRAKESLPPSVAAATIPAAYDRYLGPMLLFKNLAPDNLTR